VFLLSRLVEGVKELAALGYGYLQSLVRLLARLAFSDESSSTPVRHNASILPVMTIDLEGARAKVKRAYEHRDALEQEVAPVLNGERNQIQLSAKLDPDMRHHLFEVATMPDVWRVRIAVLLGDVVHCLRSGLDQVAWQLVLDHSGRPKRPDLKIQVEFPIKYRRKALRSTYTFGKIAGRDRTILDNAQPYKGPGNPKLHGLAIIQQLSNRDKHRLLSPILVSTTTFTLVGTELEGNEFSIFSVDFTGVGKNLKIGAEVFRCVLAPPVKDQVDVAGYSTPHIRLPQRADIPLMDGVDVMIRTVSDILGDFAAAHGV
jgi:hypothetical protein